MLLRVETTQFVDICIFIQTMNYQFPRPRMLQMKFEPNWASRVQLKENDKESKSRTFFFLFCFCEVGGRGGTAGLGRARGGVGRELSNYFYM